MRGLTETKRLSLSQLKSFLSFSFFFTLQSLNLFQFNSTLSHCQLGGYAYEIKLLKSKITYNANRADRYNASANIYNSTAVRHFLYFHFTQITPNKNHQQCGNFFQILFSNRSKVLHYLWISFFLWQPAQTGWKRCV